MNTKSNADQAEFNNLASQFITGTDITETSEETSPYNPFPNDIDCSSYLEKQPMYDSSDRYDSLLFDHSLEKEEF